LLLLAPPTEVISGALCDELRLTGSQMDNNDQLLSKLRLAVHHLSTPPCRQRRVTSSGSGDADFVGDRGATPGVCRRAWRVPHARRYAYLVADNSSRNSLRMASPAAERQSSTRRS